MATIVEVSRRAGVSIATVSNVITGAVRVSPELQKRVLAAIDELDYHPNHVARSLKTKSTRLLGMIVSDITNPFFPLLVRGAEDAALDRNYLLITFNTDDQVEREARMISVLRSRKVDGILLVMAPSMEEPVHIRNVLRAGVPLVCLDRPPIGFQADSVAVDNTGGSFACVQHLLALGHRHIGIMTGPMSMQIASERYQGYENAMLAAGLEVNPNLIRGGDFRVESGYLLAKEWLSQPNRPTALFVSNNNMVVGVLLALEELGLSCPADLALTVFDDLPPTAAFRSHLTAATNPAYTMGHRGVELLLDRIEKKETSPGPISIRLKSELIVRESSGRQIA